jgi:hypothetical protein
MANIQLIRTEEESPRAAHTPITLPLWSRVVYMHFLYAACKQHKIVIHYSTLYCMYILHIRMSALRLRAVCSFRRSFPKKYPPDGSCDSRTVAPRDASISQRIAAAYVHLWATRCRPSPRRSRIQYDTHRGRIEHPEERISCREVRGTI